MRAVFRTLALISFTALIGCQQAAPSAPLKPLSFTQYPVINLNVASIEVKEEYKSPLKSPNVEQQFRTPPVEAMRQWVKERIRAVGGARTLQVLIKDASVVEEPLPRTQGFKGTFTNDQAQKYTARLEVEMRIYGTESAISEASISVVATRSDTAGESFSPADRNALYERMTRDLMSVMNAELEKNFQQYFSNYVSYTPPM